MVLFRRTSEDPCHGDRAAREFVKALKKSDWWTAGTFLARESDHDRRSLFLRAAGEVDGLQERLDEWAFRDPSSTLPLLVQGAHAVAWAWRGRGEAAARDTRQDQFALFHRRLHIAEEVLGEVVAREPGDASAWSLLVTAGRGLQLDADTVRERYAAAVTAHPGHLEANSSMLQYLCAKWGGDHQTMLDFARTTFLAAPEGHPLGFLIADAHIELWLDSGDEGYFSREEVVTELRLAAGRSVLHPAYVPRPERCRVPNTFAFALSKSGQWRAARRCFQLTDGYLTRLPWFHPDGDALVTYYEMRSLARG